MGLFELIYFLGYKVKTAYDLLRQRRLPVRVVSVGNLTTGGAGKTPATIALALEAKRRGFRPCVLTRGYKGSLKGPLVVGTRMREEEVGDEPLLIAQSIDGIPVIKCADRYAGGMLAVHKALAPDIFILDDGYQHRRLYRDLDVLLINSIDPFDNGRLLPMGMLREPMGEVKRADVVVLTKCTGQENAELLELIRKKNSNAPVFEARHRPSHIVTLDGGRVPLRSLSGKDVCAFCGVADPDSFRHTLEATGARVRDFLVYDDHYRYGPDDLDEIERVAARGRVAWMITTEKDMMRIRRSLERRPLDLVALAIEFAAPKEFYDAVLGGAQG